MTTRTIFENTIITGDPELRGETPPGLREIQMVYRLEQTRQLKEILDGWGLDPNEIEYYQAGFDKNLCPSTNLESESGILYNNRTGVSVGIVLEWVCLWTCGMGEWVGEYEPSLDKCQPKYFFNAYNDADIQKLK